LHQNAFCGRNHWESLQRSLRPPSWILEIGAGKGEEGKWGKGKEEREGKRKGRGRGGTAPNKKLVTGLV